MRLDRADASSLYSEWEVFHVEHSAGSTRRSFGGGSIIAVGQKCARVCACAAADPAAAAAAPALAWRWLTLRLCLLLVAACVCVCVCLSGRRTHGERERTPGSSFSVCSPWFCFVVTLNIWRTDRSPLAHHLRTLRHLFFFFLIYTRNQSEGEEPKRRSGENMTWEEEGTESQRPSGSTSVAFSHSGSLIWPLFVSQAPTVTWLTSPRVAVWVRFPRAFPRRGSPVFCRVSSPRNAAAAAAAAAGWLASEKRNSLFSLHCGRDSRRARLFSACVLFSLKVWGSWYHPRTMVLKVKRWPPFVLIYFLSMLRSETVLNEMVR